MKKAIIDLDDVLSLDGFLNMLNDFNNSNYTYEETKGYYVEEILPKEKQLEFFKFFMNGNVYDYARVAPNSKEVLKKMMLYLEVYICSSYYSDINHVIMPELIPKKCEFLLSNYPFLTTKNFIFTNDKKMLNADIRIDDSINNLSNDGINLLYNAYHNKNISEKELNESGIIRVNDWLEIESELNKQKVFTIK